MPEFPITPSLLRSVAEQKNFIERTMADDGHFAQSPSWMRQLLNDTADYIERLRPNQLQDPPTVIEKFSWFCAGMFAGFAALLLAGVVRI